MQSHDKVPRREEIPTPVIRQLLPSSEKYDETLKTFGDLLHKHSWGEEYREHVQAYDELKKAEYIVVAYVGDEVAGFGAVNRFASPAKDKVHGWGIGELWLADTMVLPEFQQHGIYTMLYENRMEYVKNQKGKILVSMENPIIEKFVQEHGWEPSLAKDPNTPTVNESGAPTTIYEYDRANFAKEKPKTTS